MKPRHLIPALLCALLIVYPLSVGPVGMLYNRHYPRGSVPTWAWIYKPLEWACDHSGAFSGNVDWYLKLWGAENQN